MSAGNLHEPAHRIAEPFMNATGSAFIQVATPLVTLLARGEPVTMAELTAQSGQSPDALRATLNRFPEIEWDEQGRIVGAGLTLRPTPHSIRLDGRPLYTWCALDALVVAAHVERSVRIESRCPATGAPVRIIASSTGIESLSPAPAALTVVIPEDLSNVRSQMCAHSHFFSSAGAASQWSDGSPAAIILPAHDGLRLGRLIGNQCLSHRAPDG